MQAIKSSAGILFKNILFLSDLSRTSNGALAYALALARYFKARLYPAHVLEVPTTASTSVDTAEKIKSLEERTHRQLSRQVEYNGVRFQSLVSRTSVEAAVAHWIAEYGIDLVVLGTHGREGSPQFLLGSTAELVLRGKLCPILTIGPHVDVPRLFNLAIEEILFPADFGPQSGSALKYALSLAAASKARLTLLHVLPEESRSYPDRTQVLHFTIQELQKLLPADASDWCKTGLAVDAGETGKQILGHAHDEGASLIIMGLRREESHRAEMRTGLVYRVMSAAPCPVLMVPEDLKN